MAGSYDSCITIQEIAKLFFQNIFMYVYHPYFFHGEMSV